MSNFVRNFKKFQNKKRNGSLLIENKTTDNKDIVNESVIERDNKYIVSGISIPKSLVTTFASNIKQESGKDVFNDFSKTTVAEELVRYMIDQHSDGREIPMSAIYGGANDMERQIDDVSTEEDPLDVNDDGFSDNVDADAGDGFTDDTEIQEPIDTEETFTEEEPEELVGNVDDEFESIDDIDTDSEDTAEDGVEEIDLPSGDPITEDDIDPMEEDEDDHEDRTRRRKRRIREEDEEL